MAIALMRKALKPRKPLREKRGRCSFRGKGDEGEPGLSVPALSAGLGFQPPLLHPGDFRGKPRPAAGWGSVSERPGQAQRVSGGRHQGSHTERAREPAVGGEQTAFTTSPGETRADECACVSLKEAAGPRPHGEIPLCNLGARGGLSRGPSRARGSGGPLVGGAVVGATGPLTGPC